MSMTEKKSNGRENFSVERVSRYVIPEARADKNFQNFAVRPQMIILVMDQNYTKDEIEVIAKNFRENPSTVGNLYDLNDIINAINKCL